MAGAAAVVAEYLPAVENCLGSQWDGLADLKVLRDAEDLKHLVICADEQSERTDRAVLGIEAAIVDVVIWCFGRFATWGFSR